MDYLMQSLFETGQLINGEWYAAANEAFMCGLIYALACCVELGIGIGLAIGIPTLVKSLCKRFIWPGQKKDPPAPKQ